MSMKQKVLYLAIIAGLEIMFDAIQAIKRAKEKADEANAGG